MKSVLVIMIALLMGTSKVYPWGTPPPPITPDEAEFTAIAKMILDSSLSYGLFESPLPLDRLRSLKSGVVPEMEDGYLEVAINNSLIKMNTLTVFRGEFDSLVYTKMPAFDMDAEETIQFMPYPGTTWLMFFRSPYNQSGNTNKAWIANLPREKTAKYLNPKTVFITASNYHGNVCIKWNKEYGADDVIPVAANVFEADLKLKSKTISTLPLDKKSPEYTTKINTMVSAMKDVYGKGVANSLRKILLDVKVPEVEKEVENKDQ
ncbi:MAG: hypothetical protein NTX03_05920 [Bacteroidetes bacterium]|nr:hypothetical protein [Bacteroidota bacterium]